MRVLKMLGALVVLLAVLVVPPWALIWFVGNPYPPEGVSLSAPLTDGAIIGLLAVVVWVLWLQLVACVVVEVAAAIGGAGRRARLDQVRVPFTLGVQQDFARKLVTAIVLAAGPGTAVVSGGAAMADAAVVETPQTTQHADAHTAAAEAVDEVQPREVEREEAVKTRTETTVRLDTLPDIAERTLGDADRWPEIADLNAGREMADGTVFTSTTHIRAGWQLLVPDEPQTPASGEVAEHVERGDTISDYALKHYGDANQWPKIFEANEGTAQPGGKHLTNPHHIEPGWTIAIPDVEAAPAIEESPGEADSSQTTPVAPSKASGATGEARGERATPVDSSRASAQAPAQEAAGRGEHVAAEADEADQGGITALDALLATAGSLAAGALALLMANRVRQWRRRKIGRTIASTPADLVEVEQAIIEHGTAAQKDAEFIDRALRYVAAACKVADAPLPQLGAAVLGEEDLTLLFTQPAAADVPEGWTATDDARAWMLPRWTILEEELENQPPPYPALVSVGLDEGGRTWYLDLETLGMCGIGGDPQQVDGLARFMVAELAVSRWAEGCEVLLADEFAAETVRLNPARLRQVPRSDALARATVLTGEMAEGEQNLDADVLTRRRDGLLLDTTNPVVVVVASRPEGEFVPAVEDRARSRVVVLHGDEESPAVELASDGTAFLPLWGISVNAFTMQADEAAPMADLMTSTRNLTDEPVPVTQSDDGPLGKYARADGSLREEYTAPRHTEGNDPSSMLPDGDEVYLAAAATTTEDLAAAAPSVPAEVRAEIEALDPTLDQDVEDWFDSSSPRPKVHLLGPVEVNALNGGDPAAINTLGGTISFIAYLAVQDHGVTGERAAAACGWKTQKTVQNRATNARFLLGTRPDGTDWLPDASMSAGAQRGTSPTYELVRGTGGVLNSGDLFVRLKNRAERRGDNGCEEDLVTALSLVTGAPFEAATEHRFKWLFKPGQQRHDEILVGAIHDAAHILATRAVAAGRTDLVRLACDAARKASPHSDIAWLDQAAATEAEAGRTAAGELVREQVLDRFDEDLPARSESIVEQREWGATG